MMHYWIYRPVRYGINATVPLKQSKLQTQPMIPPPNKNADTTYNPTTITTHTQMNVVCLKVTIVLLSCFIGWVQMRSAQPILSGHEFWKFWNFWPHKKCRASSSHLSYLLRHYRISRATGVQLTWDHRICRATIVQPTWDHRLLIILLSDDWYSDNW